jgi:hypothetical protein
MKKHQEQSEIKSLKIRDLRVSPDPGLFKPDSEYIARYFEKIRIEMTDVIEIANNLRNECNNEIKGHENLV